MHEFGLSFNLSLPAPAWYCLPNPARTIDHIMANKKGIKIFDHFPWKTVHRLGNFQELRLSLQYILRKVKGDPHHLELLVGPSFIKK